MAVTFRLFFCSLVLQLAMTSVSAAQVQDSSPESTAAPRAAPDEPDTVGPTDNALESETGGTDLQRRVEILEHRVEQLESILFATAQLNVAQAERHVEEIRELVRETERLYAQGLTSTVQLQNDRFLLQQAVLELRLAHAGNDGRFIACQIAVAGAENNLRLAVERLRLSEEQLVRGFIPPERVQRDRRDVELLELELDAARKRLEAVESLSRVPLGNPAESGQPGQDKGDSGRAEEEDGG